ncbi:hypothetical protein C8R46DRAFT_1350555 [Mycena filopes]|nr:hypothetical protein C8R46DRAFT_1350555 [Mycena filopes]
MVLQRLYRAFVAAVFSRLASSASPKPQLDASPLPQPPTRLAPNFTISSLAQTRCHGRAFTDLTLDLILVIMAWCGPHDLLALQDVCATFRLLLFKNRYIWRLARANLELGFPLPIAAPSEEWFVRYALAGGSCTVCRRPTQALSYSYSLGIRICSASCSYYLLRASPGNIDESIIDRDILTCRPDDLDELETLMLNATPYLEGTAAAPLYRPSAIHDAYEEFYAAMDFGSLASLELTWKQRAAAMPIFMAMTEALQEAAQRYRDKKEIVERRNRALMATIARENNLEFDQLITSPTLVQSANTFARDLTCMTPQAWSTIRETCLEEIAWLRVAKARIVCRHCPGRKQKYTWAGLQGHIRAIHPESYSSIALNTHTCALCPHTTKFTQLQHLKRHVYTAHLATRTDL